MLLIFKTTRNNIQNEDGEGESVKREALKESEESLGKNLPRWPINRINHAAHLKPHPSAKIVRMTTTPLLLETYRSLIPQIPFIFHTLQL